MLWHTLLVSSTLVTFVLSAPTRSLTLRVIHEKSNTALPSERQRVDPDAIIPIRIGLQQSNLHTGYERLLDISHPTSENYGKHLSAEEVNSIFAPAKESIETVKNWLLGEGVNEEDILHYDNQGWIGVNMPASQAESLLSTEYYELQGSDAKMRIGCDQYSLPAYVSKHVDLVKPGIKLSSPLKKRTVKRDETLKSSGSPQMPSIPSHQMPHWPIPPGAGHLPPDLQSCSVNITPTCIKALYQIPPARLSQPENVLGFFESGDAFSQADLNMFFHEFAPNVPKGTTPTVNSVDGGVAPVAAASDSNTGESDIDLDLAFSLIYPQTVTVYQVDDALQADGAVPGFLDDFFDAVDGSYCNYTAFGITGNSPGIDPVYPDPAKSGYKGKLMCGGFKLARVVSISYGETEFTLPKNYVQRWCSEAMKLSLQGHTLITSAGDWGVAGAPGMQQNEFGCLPSTSGDFTVYNPDYPAVCPFVTTVGATRLYPNQTVEDPESAMQVNLTQFFNVNEGSTVLPTDFFATGGGFSNYFETPSYQKEAVENYLARHTTLPSYSANSNASNMGDDGGVYNRVGRGYPDVSANGAFLQEFVHKTLMTNFGTSLAAPIFASILTLINEERTTAGKGPVGFVNPVLYQHPEVFNDITNGSNPNCGSEGFSASPGWDPVTGLGTPNYPRMLNLFMSLP